MSTPIVSIIIPIYNTAPFLCECLDSVLHQTISDWEIVLLNDGSPDNADDICLQYVKQDSRINYVKKENTGLSDTRNVGIQLARGKYLMFLDSDDYLDTSCIEEMMKEMTDKTSLVVSGYTLCDGQSNVISRPKQQYGVYPDIHSFVVDFKNLFATKFNFVWGKLYRSEIVKNNNLIFEKGISLVEDLLFNMQYYHLCTGCIVLTEGVGVYYRQHGSSTLSKRYNPQTLNWEFLSFGRLREYLQEEDAFNDSNRTHLERNYRASITYDIQQYTLCAPGSVCRKVAKIKKIINQSTIRDIKPDKTNRICFGLVQQWLIQHNAIYIYYFLTKLRYYL